MLLNDGINDNHAAIQAMLDKGGIVMIDKPGKYLISKTLVIHSNTRFVLAPGAELIAAPMSRCALIENEHFRGGGKDKNIEIIGGTWDGNCDAQGYDSQLQAILDEAERLALKIDEERFRRTLRAEYGAQVRNLNSFDDICIQLARGWFKGYHYFDFAECYESITAKDVSDFLAQTVRQETSCLSVVYPKGA